MKRSQNMASLTIRKKRRHSVLLSTFAICAFSQGSQGASHPGYGSNGFRKCIIDNSCSLQRHTCENYSKGMCTAKALNQW